MVAAVHRAALAAPQRRGLGADEALLPLHPPALAVSGCGAGSVVSILFCCSSSSLYLSPVHVRAEHVDWVAEGGYIGEAFSRHVTLIIH